MSSNPVIIELSSNDDITNIVKKCNQNFRSIFGANISMSSDTPDQFDPSELTEAIRNITDAISNINDKVDSIKIPDPFDPTYLEEAIKKNSDDIIELNTKIDSIVIPDDIQ